MGKVLYQSILLPSELQGQRCDIHRGAGHSNQALDRKCGIFVFQLGSALSYMVNVTQEGISENIHNHTRICPHPRYKTQGLVVTFVDVIANRN